MAFRWKEERVEREIVRRMDYSGMKHCLVAHLSSNVIVNFFLAKLFHGHTICKWLDARLHTKLDLAMPILKTLAIHRTDGDSVERRIDFTELGDVRGSGSYFFTHISSHRFENFLDQLGKILKVRADYTVENGE